MLYYFILHYSYSRNVYVCAQTLLDGTSTGPNVICRLQTADSWTHTQNNLE